MPTEDVQRRKLRDAISDDLLDYLEGFFFKGSDYLNRRWDLMEVMTDFLKDYPPQHPYTTSGKLREKLAFFCQYAGYVFNPSSDGKRMRNGTTNAEWFVIADENYSAAKEKELRSDKKFGDAEVKPELLKATPLSCCHLDYIAIL